MYNKLLRVSKKIGIPTKKVLDVVYFLKKNVKIDNNELLVVSGVSRNAINQLKKELNEYLEKPSQFTQIKKDYSKVLKKLFDTSYHPEEDILKLPDSDITFSKERVDPDRNFDQFTATKETVGKRSSLLNYMADVKGKRILFLGDDDFTSVAVAKLKIAAEIAVLDIDKRIIEKIQSISEENSLGIKTKLYDARAVLPQDFANKFDIVFTDPPYTPDGINLFLSRAISALDKTNQAARIYICYGNSDRAKDRFLKIYQIIIDSGMFIRWMFDKFNRYHGAESIGSSSSLYILDTTSKTKPLITKNYDEPIYTNN